MEKAGIFSHPVEPPYTTLEAVLQNARSVLGGRPWQIEKSTNMEMKPSYQDGEASPLTE